MIGQTSFGKRITDIAQSHPDSVALVHVAPDGSERSATFLQLERRSNQVARMLAGRGVGQGSMVVIALHNSLEHFYCVIATWKLGATPLPMRWDLPAWERQRLLDLAQPTAVIGSAQEPVDGEIRLEDIDATTALDDGALPDRIPQPLKAIASSGSSGKAKLIVTPSPGVVTDGGAIATLMKRMGVQDGDTQLLVSPLYHTNGFNSHFGLQRRQRIIILEKFDAERAVDLIERYKVNYIVMVPIMLQRIARVAGVQDRDFSSIRAIHYGGATIPDWLVQAWFQLVGPAHFFFSYGGTEGIGVAFGDGEEWLAHKGSTGRGLATTIRIQDEQGKVVPTGTVGNIYMKREGAVVGPSFEYIGATAPQETPDGFTTFGDLGRLDEDGYLYIADRRSDMIVSGGVNIFPAEVETALSEHPEVHDVVVIGMPDPEWGRRVHAIIEPKDPKSPPTKESLLAHCRKLLVAYKVPKSIEIIDHMPRTAAGKINRNQLAADRSPEPVGTP
jgi:bile acid-coenzyme A ligase